MLRISNRDSTFLKQENRLELSLNRLPRFMVYDETLKITKEEARRFVVAKQCFGLPKASVSKEEVFRVLKALGCVQIDMISVVERSHYLVFWSRLGNYRKEHLDQLLSPDRYYRFFLHAKKQRQKQTAHNIRRYLKAKPA